MAVCQTLFEVFGNSLTIEDYIVFPTTCYYYFYLVILSGLFFLFTLFLYNKEKEDFAKPDIISSAGTSATAIFFLALIGTLIESSTGLPMVQQDVFLYIIAMWLVIVGIWFFKK